MTFQVVFFSLLTSYIVNSTMSKESKTIYYIFLVLLILYNLMVIF